ncbi:hypothetical protein NP233_g2667 [Leucocoprinus birnbaumii]|uniref:DUF6533 domain-containing protein n=1 Tax=Leucocoprinus birnbaumii TaxID=56174 RepID=A0AAD5VYI0_9AGAR|nr:hypothetical protein NP233_g2667 [Leucocoprinus birnbaumii]
MDQAAGAVVDEIALFIVRDRQINSASLPGIVIALFDWLLNLDLELRFVWKQRWNMMKVLYLVNRYIPFFNLPILLYCGQLRPGRSASRPNTGSWDLQSVVHYGLSAVRYSCVYLRNRNNEVISAIGVWVLWGKGTRLGYFLFGAFSILWTAVFILEGFFLVNASHSQSPAPALLGCLLLNKGPYLVICFGLFMLLEVVLLMLVLRKAFVSYIKSETSPYKKVLYRDCAIYYLGMFSLALLNVIIMAGFPVSYDPILLLIVESVHSVMSCRIILQLREEDQRNLLGLDTSSRLSTWQVRDEMADEYPDLDW